MKRNILVQFIAARKIIFFSDSFGAIFNMFGTYFGTKHRVLGLFSIKVEIVNWFLKKWMKCNILAHFFAARIMRIFSEYFGLILNLGMLDLFWYQTEIFGPISVF